MMPSKEIIKKTLIILVLLFVNVWFLGNATLEYIIYDTLIPKPIGYIDEDFIDNALIPNLNGVPRELEIPKKNVEGEYLYFYDYKVKLPFIKGEKYITVTHDLTERRVSGIEMTSSDKRGKLISIIRLDESPRWILKGYEDDKPLWWKFLDIISLSDLSKQFRMEKIYYARLRH